jgi:hypothetical protein
VGEKGEEKGEEREINQKDTNSTECAEMNKLQDTGRIRRIYTEISIIHLV